MSIVTFVWATSLNSIPITSAYHNLGLDKPGIYLAGSKLEMQIHHNLTNIHNSVRIIIDGTDFVWKTNVAK